jgi:LysR family transcriptional regulator, glycine cleavage system transcriptional activator
MRKYIPTLLELQAFEATVRHLNVTRAAQELNTTQSSISHHIAKLENLVGVQLFERIKRRLVLTDAGILYAEQITPILVQLERMTAELSTHGGKGGALNLACPTTFGVNWLIPRMPKFVEFAPHVTLILKPHPHLKEHDVWLPEVDAAIRYGEGAWPHAVSTYIMGNDMVVICSPKWMVGKDRLSKPEQLIHRPLVQHINTPYIWDAWFEAQGVKHPLSNVGPRFDPFSMIIRAAAAGIGAGLVPHCIAQSELLAGNIVVPFNINFQSPKGYFLVCPEGRRNSPVIRTFKEWVVNEGGLTS